MKKIQIFCLAVLCMALFGACKDDTGTYADQLYTNGEKAAAIKACLDSSLDTAVAHLCQSGGFSNYKDGFYKLDYAPSQALFDTLAAHGYSALGDSLILFTNRMAESCSSVVTTAFGDAIEDLVVYDYDALIGGESTAITDYFSEMKSNTVRDALKSQVSIRMGLFNVNSVWNEMAGNYYNITGTPVSYDVQGYILDKMVNGILDEMRCEEYLIRTDSTHRVEDNMLLGE